MLVYQRFAVYVTVYSSFAKPNTVRMPTIGDPKLIGLNHKAIRVQLIRNGKFGIYGLTTQLHNFNRLNARF